jgi:predicted ATPase
LIDALEGAGYARTVEAGRAIIRDQVAIGGNALPWSNAAAYAELMLSWEMRSYHIAQRQIGRVFFDRGVPDVIGYLRLIGLPVPAHIERAAEACRYNKRVFMAPPWADIFEQDNERRQTFDEALRTHEALTRTYTDYGYEIVELPRLSICRRLQFVIDTVTQTT